MQRRTKFILLGAYYLFWMIFGILTAFLSTPICLQRPCVDKSASIVNSMDPGISPCRDFYSFVCGSVPKYFRPTYNASGKAYSSVYAMMIGKVTDYVGQTRSGAFTQEDIEKLYHENLIGLFYGMCEKIEKTQSEGMITDVTDKVHQSIQGANMAIRDMMSKERFNHSFTSGIYEVKSKVAGFPGRHFFSSEIARDSKNPDLFTLVVSRPKSFVTIPISTFDNIPKDRWFPIFVALLKEFVPSTTEEFIGPNEERDTFIREIIALWFELKNIYHEPATKTLVGRHVRLDKMQKRFPNLDFDGYLKSIGAPKKCRQYIFLETLAEPYFDKLQPILDKYSRQTLVLYQLIQNLLDVMPFMIYSTPTTAGIEPLGDLSSQVDQCKNMLGSRFGGMALSLVIERFRLEKNDPEAIAGSFVEYVKGMKSRLHKAYWMDSATRTSAIEKLRAMRDMLSLSNSLYNSVKTPGKRAKYYNGLCYMRTILLTLMCMNRFFAKKNLSLYTRTVTGFDDSESVSMSEIKYNQEDNTFSVPILILRFPAYDTAWPEHINYGGLGIEITSELTSGFDYEGSKYDKFGVQRSWWTNKTYDNYKKLEFTCEKLLREAEKSSHIIKYNVTNPRSLTDEELMKGELMKPYWKYLMGVKVAYHAYTQYKKTLTYKESKLPGFEMYTTEQVFFMSHAHSRCLPPLQPGDHEALKMDTENYFLALSSIKEFDEAFGCSSRKANRKAEIINKAAHKCVLF